MFAAYKLERENKITLQSKFGFAIYCFEGEYCYIEDIYVTPSARRTGRGLEMVNEIVKIAKEKGYSKLLGSVCLATKTCDEALKAHLAIGFKLKTNVGQLIFLEKEI